MDAHATKHPPKKRTLDFSRCKTSQEIHKVIQKELELPQGYGQNLDALWDAITGMMYLPAQITIVFRPETKQAAALLPEIQEIAQVFQEAAAEYGEITLQLEI